MAGKHRRDDPPKRAKVAKVKRNKVVPRKSKAKDDDAPTVRDPDLAKSVNEMLKRKK